MPRPKGDGGPAFPTENERPTGNSSYHYQGMSLRDYFAAKAMQGMLVDKEIDCHLSRKRTSKRNTVYETYSRTHLRNLRDSAEKKG